MVAFKCHYCGRLLVKDAKDVYLRSYFGPEGLTTIRFCTECAKKEAKNIDERSEKTENDVR